MWMKPLSLFTFSVFLVLLGANLYKNQSDKFDKVGMKEEHRSLFEMEPEQARALLDDLDVYVKKDKAMKDAQKFAKTTKSIKSPKERKRRLASRPSMEKNEPATNEKLNEQLKDKYTRLEEAFLAREDNLLEVRFMQDEIRRLKEENEIEQSNIETWSTEFIFLLMIQERLGFDEIISIKNPSDLGLGMDEWLSLKAKAETDDFKLQIMRFKGIEAEEDEELDEITIDDQDFEPAKDREQALREFGKRNQESREGYSEETREAEEISFSNEENEYDEANDYYREPSSQDEEGLNNENDYEY